MKKNKEIKNLHKHLKRIASDNSRPILNCVHYDEDKSIIVTDAHRLLKINEFHKNKNGFNQDMKTMKIVEDKYPETERLIPKEFRTEITISLAVLIRIMKALGTSNWEGVKWSLGEDKIIFANYSDERYYGKPIKITTNARIEGEIYDITFNAKYVKECCEFFMDAKDRYAIDDVKIKMNSPIEPAIFKINEKYLYLVTPMRTT